MSLYNLRLNIAVLLILSGKELWWSRLSWELELLHLRFLEPSLYLLLISSQFLFHPGINISIFRSVPQFLFNFL